MGRAQGFDPGARAVRLVISMLPDADIEDDGTVTMQYKAVALVPANGGERQSYRWQGGLRIDWTRTPAATNQDIETAAKAALTEQTGHAWRPLVDRASLFGGRVS